MQTCPGTGCEYRMARSADAGATWHLGGLVTRDKPPAGDSGGYSSLSGLLATDSEHWYAWGQRGLWVSADAGASWHHIRTGGQVSSVTAAPTGVWALHVSCTGTPVTCSNTAFTFDRAGRLTTTSALGWLSSTSAVTQLLRVGNQTYATLWSWAKTGNKATLALLRNNDPYLSPVAIRPLPAASRTLAADGAHLDLLAAWDPAAGSQDKMFYRSEDGGRSWQRLPDPSAQGYATDLSVPSPGLLWRYGDRFALYRSTDGGHSWTALLATHIGDGGYPLKGFAAQQDSAWAASFHDDGDTPGVWVTRDGGDHWTFGPLP
jgi:hypothetical protein